MGLLQRISDLLRSNINDLISRAEDPEKLLNAAIEDMQRQLVEAKSRVAMSIADEKRLQKQHDSERKKADDWEGKAMAAVRAGRDDLAVEAIGRKKEHEAAALQYKEQLDGQQSAVDELKRALGELSAKLDDTKRRRTLLLARAKRAEAQRQIAETLNTRTHSSAQQRLELLESRVEQAEARAEAHWELASVSGETSYERSLAAEIEMLGEPDDNDELAALKARVKELDALPPGPSRAALPEPAASPTAASETEPPEAPEPPEPTPLPTDGAEPATETDDTTPSDAAPSNEASPPEAEDEASPKQNVG